MTPRMRQSVELLRMNNLEIAGFVAAQVEGNPFLRQALPKRSSGGGTRRESWGGQTQDTSNWQDNAADTPTLYGHLTQQIRLSFSEPRDSAIAFHLMTLLDERGYLMPDWRDTSTHLSCTPKHVESVLSRLQKLEPTGIFARDLGECLRLQWQERDDWSPAADRLLDNLFLLAKRDYEALEKTCGLDTSALKPLVTALRRLNPKPLSDFEPPQRFTPPPDLLVERLNGVWQIRVNDAVLPRVLLDESYVREIRSAAQRRRDKDYLAERLRHARWLTRALDQRMRTLMRVAEAIFQRQALFLDQGPEVLRPLTLKEIAGVLALHESTVSRSVADKTVETPQGLFDLRFFFSARLKSEGETISATAVRARLRRLVEEERPDRVLSDAAITEHLCADGILISRRTVAKYRELLRIPSAPQRRREKRMRTTQS